MLKTSRSFALGAIFFVTSVVNINSTKPVIVEQEVVERSTGSVTVDGVITTPALKYSSVRTNVRELVQERLQEHRQLREEFKNRWKEKVATVQAKLEERVRARIRFFFGRITLRMEAAIARLDFLATRIENRLEILKKEGEDVSEIQKEVDEAQKLIADAKVLLSEAKNNLENVLNSENPKEAFTVIRDSVRAIKDTLIEAHGILVKVIGDIKGLRVGNTPQ